jgi:streptogramin lyase
MRDRIALLFCLALGGCGGGSGGGAGVPPSPTPAPSGATLRPTASIRLSGSAASGLAEGGGWLWVSHFESTFLSQVDTRAAREIGVVEVGPHAGSVTAIGPELWIGQYTTRPEDARLTWVDPSTAVVVGRAQPSHLCCEVAGAAGRVFAVDPRGVLQAVDPGTGRVTATAPVPIDPAVHIGLVGDDRALWLSSDTTPLLRIDPGTLRQVVSLDVGGGIPMAIAQGLVWGAGPRHVWAVDPAANEVRARIPLENTIETLSLAVAGDTLWVGARRPGSVGVLLRIDLASGRLTGEAAVSLPARVLNAQGFVWVVDWDTNTLLRFEYARTTRSFGPLVPQEFGRWGFAERGGHPPPAG